MSNRAPFSVLFAIVCGVAFGGSPSPELGPRRPSPFVKNVGQLPADVLYYASVPGGRIFVRADDLVFQLVEAGANQQPRGDTGRWAMLAGASRTRRSVNVRCRLPGAAFEVTGEGRLSARINLLLGNRPEHWFGNVPAFGRLRLRGIAGGGDLILGPLDGDAAFWRIERAMGSAVGMIAPKFEAPCPVRYEPDRVLIDTPFGTREIGFPQAGPPTARRRAIMPAVDTTRANARLVKTATTPVQLAWGTYLSSGDDSRSVGGSTLDAAGNTYLVGSLSRPDGTLDTWVTMLAASGSAQPWAIDFGSSLTVVGNAIAVDGDGNVFVVGYTDDPALPSLGGYDGTINGSLDAFVVKLSPGQDIVWTTYLGGAAADFAHAVAIAPSGGVIVAGDTGSADFPTPSGYDPSFGGEVDGFLAMLSADGARLVWSTYLGGAKWEHLAGIALSPGGGPVAVGATASTDFPTPGGLFRTNQGGTDMFVASLTPVGELQWATLLGGSDSDLGEAVAVGPSGDVSLCGGTASTAMPIAGGIQTTLRGLPYDGYVARIRAAGDALVWATYLGGDDSDTCSALRLDAAGNVVAGGMSWSSDFPTLHAYSATLDGLADATIAKIASSGSELLWATYLGGSERDGAQALEVLPTGRVLVAGDTKSADVPTTPGLDQTFSGSDDAFAAALTDPTAGSAPTADFTWSPSSPAVSEPVQFTDTSSGAPTSWSWSFGDGGTSTQQNPTHTYTACGAKTVVLTAGNAAGSGSVTKQLTISGCPTMAYPVWIPVASHGPGYNGSQWRTDVGILNLGATTANVELQHIVGATVKTGATYVPAGAQSILVDVVAQIGSSGTGPIRVRSDRPVIVTSRTYNQIPPEQSCLPNGTQGQSHPTLADGEGLAEGQTAVLPQLTEDDQYRTNIMLINVSGTAATATVTLYDGAGTQLGSPYTVSLGPGERKQEDKVFRTKGGQTNMARGYAKITVTGGSGVVAFASVVDNVTNDPTTIPMAP